MIKSVYPQPAGGAADVPERPAALSTAPARVVQHTGRSEIVLAVDLDDARARGEASSTASSSSYRKSAISSPTMNRCSSLYGGAASIDESILRATVAIGLRADDRAGPAVRVPHPGRYRAEGAVAGDQRPDDGRARDRSDSSPAARRRPAATARRDRSSTRRDVGVSSIARRTGRTSSTSRAPRSAAAAPANVQIARRLRAMLENLVASLPAHRHGADRGASAAGSDDRAALSAAGRSGPGAHSGFARAGRLARRPALRSGGKGVGRTIDGGVSRPPTRRAAFTRFSHREREVRRRAVTSRRSR